MTRRNRKIGAFAAGAVVVGLGLTYTLATWNDSEWVWGGVNGEAGIGASSFNVQQDTSSPFTTGSFGDFETNPGDELMFSAGALALSPGDSVYAPVALRTEMPSLAGEVTLQAAEPALGITVDDTGGLLWDAMTVTVYTAAGETPPEACDADLTPGSWTTLVADKSLNAGGAATAQTLAAQAGSVQHYCFVLTLPTEAQIGTGTELMGRTIAPAWEFAAESVA